MNGLFQKTIFNNEDAKGWVPWSFLSPFIAILIIAIPLLLSSEMLISFDLLHESGDPESLTEMIWFLFVPFICIGLTTVIWLTLIEKRSLLSAGLCREKMPENFLIGYFVGAAMILVLVASITLLNGYTLGKIAPGLADPSMYMPLALLLLGFIVQSSVEELVFRGWLLSVLTRKSNFFVGMIISSIVFTFLHWSPDQHWLTILSSLLFSIFACLWVYKYNSLWGAMGWHAGWNGILATGFELPLTGKELDIPAMLVEVNPTGNIIVTGGSQGPEGSILCSIIFVIGIAILLNKARGN